MAAPTVSASLDKATYKVGDLMTLTVTYGDSDNKSVTVTVTVTDASGNSSSPVTVAAVIDPLTLAVTEAGKTWAKASDNGSVAVYTRTA